MLGIITYKDINLLRINLWIFLGCIGILSIWGLLQKNTNISGYSTILLIFCIFIIMLTLIKCEIQNNINQNNINQNNIDELNDFDFDNL